MSQPFREGGVPCPACNVSLRDLGVAGRLVCDHCGGMMLTRADFEHSLLGTSGDIPKLVIEERTARACPRCQQPLMSAEIVSGGTALPQVVHACARDGVWLDGGTLEPILEELGRSAHGFTGSGSARSFTDSRGGFAAGAIAGIGPVGYGAGQGVAFAVGAVSTAFAQRATFVRWWDRKPRPRVVHAPFASTFRAGALACPVCAAQLELHGNLWGCHEVNHGVFVETAALEAMIAEMIGAPWQLDVPSGVVGLRACPACAKALVVEDLEGVTVDRCADHGIWFDPTELEDTLAHAAEAKRRGLRHWLRHLFE